MPEHDAPRAAAGALGHYARQLVALVAKDLRLETRRRETIVGVLVFVLLVLALFQFALDLERDTARRLVPGLLWITFLFAGLLTLGRTFAAERDQGTLDGLLLAPLDRSVLYLAKVVATVVIMGLVELVALPVFAAVFDVPLLTPGVLFTVLLGTVGFAAAGTLFAALATQTRARDVLLPLLLLPLLVPLLIAAARATDDLLAGAATPVTAPWWELLAGLDALFLGVAVLLFEALLEE
ncbi:MAG: heme exporter protein CcmB [Chloroflexi bacterium]|nr:heme exporter protein CcmB [Chloroflexota bacterium]